MDSRGQVSVEYLFLILIFLIILGAVTVPFAGNTISSSMNVSITSDAKTAVTTIGNAVNVVYSNGPGAVRTVNVYIPQDTTLSYSSNFLFLDLTGIPVSSSDPGGAQKPHVNSSVPFVVHINNGTSANVDEGWHNFRVTWYVGSNLIDVTVDPT